MTELKIPVSKKINQLLATAVYNNVEREEKFINLTEIAKNLTEEEKENFINDAKKVFKDNYDLFPPYISALIKTFL